MVKGSGEMPKGNHDSLYVLLAILFLSLPLFWSSMVNILENSQGNLITGMAQNANTSVNITVSSVAPGVNAVSIIGAQSITEASTTAVEFSFLATDSDGVTDLNDTSAQAQFDVTQTEGGAIRFNSSCEFVADLNSSTANYTCAINIWFFDAPGNITVNATVRDIGGSVGTNTSSNFTLQQTAAMVMAPSSLTWSSVAVGATNQTSSNDPITINNTGNKNITIGNLNITAVNLQGETVESRYLNVSNFSVDTNAGGSPPVECNKVDSVSTQLINNTAVVTGPDGNLTRGNNSINDNTIGQEQIFFCITEVTAGATPQAYSTGNVGLWTVSIQ
ncbi:MAG: hypothetical protein Q8R00_03925 [Candidatus Nanoarchaeia archaeon]|nr:hypothetical protein [Candidatus Nanoarchaeia archaeon]